MTRSWRRTQTSGLALLALMIGLLVVAAPEALAKKPKCFGRTATQVGTNGDNEILGTSGTDVVVAKGGNDLIRTGKGKDFVCAGGGGFDAIFLGPGNDKVKGQGGDDAVFPGTGSDLVDTGPGNDFVTYEGTTTPISGDLAAGEIIETGTDTLLHVEGMGGSEADDVIRGTDEDNLLYGNGGNDEIEAFGGNDFVSAGAGNDTLDGGDGADTLDLLTAFGGPDLGDDIMATSGGEANLSTGTVVGGDDVGNDTFSGFEGVGGTRGDDTLIGNDEPNRLISFAGDDQLTGGGADDLLEPGTGADSANGGDGVDSVDYFGAEDGHFGEIGPVTIDLVAQTATGTELGDDTLSSIEGGGGTLLDDTIIGNDQANPYMVGDEGSDTISGGAGDDFLDGDIFTFGFPFELSGDDSLDGGEGTDTCLGGQTNTACEVTEPAGRVASQMRAWRAAARYYPAPTSPRI